MTTRNRRSEGAWPAPGEETGHAPGSKPLRLRRFAAGSDPRPPRTQEVFRSLGGVRWILQRSWLGVRATPR
jgi:hypothetical protein